MQARKFIVRGRVQGVGYRYFVLRCARERGVVGCARNLWDGDVEVVAQASPEVLDLFEADLRRGPRAAHVTGIVSEEVDLPPFRDFGIEFSGE